MRELKGIYPAIVTPFDRDGSFDPGVMRQVIQHQLRAGVHGFYVTGGTGEGLLLTQEERREALETVLDEGEGRVGVIAQVGAFQTGETIELARHASEVGVDAIAAIPPSYFFKPDTEGLVRYYSAVADASDVPLLVYNIPQRTGISMTRELFDRLLQVPKVIGMKDSSGDVYALSLVIGSARGVRPVIFVGEDSAVLNALLVGACGGIGGTYNIMPYLYVQLWDAFQAGEVKEAAGIQTRINRCLDAILTVEFIAGVKQTMMWMGFEVGEPRSPLRPLLDGEKERLRRALDDVGFFKEEAGFR